MRRVKGGPRHEGGKERQKSAPLIPGKKKMPGANRGSRHRRRQSQTGASQNWGYGHKTNNKTKHFNQDYCSECISNASWPLAQVIKLTSPNHLQTCRTEIACKNVMPQTTARDQWKLYVPLNNQSPKSAKTNCFCAFSLHIKTQPGDKQLKILQSKTHTQKKSHSISWLAGKH